MSLTAPIVSRENPQFLQWRGLAEHARQRRAQRKTLLDGPHLIEEALQAGLRPERLIVLDDYARAEAWRARLPGIPMTSLRPALFKALTPVATPTGILAVLAIPEPGTSTGGDALLLDNVREPGNLGAVLRNTAAAGIDRVYLSKGCAEAWSPKALRGGQGAQFRLHIHEEADLLQVAASFPGPVLAAALGAGTSLFELDLRPTSAFIFGNEGAGLGEALLAASRCFRIPMPGGCESLNVAAASAVCLFEMVRQRQPV
jgi:TrmH family RNA methyltransferase